MEADFPQYTEPTDILYKTTSGITFNIKEPDPPNTTQYNYISGYLQKLENMLLANNFDPASGYPTLIDVDSFINWWIVKELLKDVDSPFRSSVYLYLDRGGKLKMGPLWDFDLSAGNVNYSDASLPTGWRIQVKSKWFEHLFQDPAFRAKVKARWTAVRAQHIDTLPAFMDAQAAALDASQKENFKRWPILNRYVWPNNVVLGSYPAEVAYVKNWLRTRTAWIDANLAP